MTQQHLVIFQPAGRRGYVVEGQSVRAAARQLGVEIESICAENATCGKCKVLVIDGDFDQAAIQSRVDHLSPMEVAETEYFARRTQLLNRHGWTPGQVRLACQARVCGDVLIQVPEESQGNRQIVRKSATERPIKIVPALRQYYVELNAPALGDAHGDWERLAEGLVRAMAIVRPSDAGLPSPEALSIDYPVLRDLAGCLREADWCVTATVWMDSQVVRVQPGYHETCYGAAVDIGTTTIALYLCDLRSGEVLATESDMNPQIAYGDDIMSRMQYAISEPSGLNVLHRDLINELNQLLSRAAQTAGIHTDDILEAVLVGNTTMHHLLLNLSPKNLGQAPYVPTMQRALDLKARELGIRVNASGNIHLLPIEASFVGADNVAVLLAEAPYQQDEQWLIIDIGTNAELVLGNRHRLICTSTPTGPALEGGHIEYGMRAAPGAIEHVEIDAATLEPRYQVIGIDGWNTDYPHRMVSVRGICGSAILDTIAELFRVGLLDARGRFRTERRIPRLRETEQGWEYVLAWQSETLVGQDIPITSRDVRQIQLAKAALYVAARTLLRAMKLERPDRILIAGGFGGQIDKTKAMLLGLIPDCPLDSVYAVGNSAGDGARIALLNYHKRREAVDVARHIERFELPVDPSFQTEFMLALNFPHMVEPFSHVAHLIPGHGPDPMAARLQSTE